MDYSRFAVKIQDIVYYAESRFRAVLTYISNKEVEKPDPDRNLWVQTLLHREVVSIIAFNLYNY